MKIRDQRQEQLRDFGELFDITARRHKGNEQSTSAFHVIKDKLTMMQREVLLEIQTSGDRGITVDEIAVRNELNPNAISGRVSELKALGKIYKSGKRKTRSGCSAAILKAFT
jgi:hypothetical protein